MSLKPILIFLAASLAACHPPSSPNIPSKPLIIATSLPLGGVDPFKSRSGIGANIVELLYKPLFRIDAYANIRPEFAKEVLWKNDQKTELEILLNEDSAGDVKASVERARAMGSGDLFEGLKNLKNIEVNAPNKVHFKLNRYDRAFLVLLSQIPIVRFSETQMETGEFSVSKRDDTEIILTRKNPSLDKVNQIYFKVIPSSRRAMRELVAGNVDFIFFARESDFKVLSDIPEISLDQVKSRILYQVLENKNSKSAKYKINWNQLFQLLNNNNLFSEIGNKESALPAFPVPYEDSWYPAEGREINVSQDVVTGSGLRSRMQRSLSFLGEQSRDRRIARILKRSFEEIGVELILLDLSPGEFNRLIFVEKNFDLVLLPFNVKDTLVSNILVFQRPEGPNSLNFSNYSNHKVDQFLDLARYTSDDAEAKKHFSAAMHELRADPPGLFLFWLKIPIVMRENCSGYRFDTNNEFFSSLKDVRCEPSAAN